jgi:hypothetical protein
VNAIDPDGRFCVYLDGGGWGDDGVPPPCPDPSVWTDYSVTVTATMDPASLVDAEFPNIPPWVNTPTYPSVPPPTGGGGRGGAAGTAQGGNNGLSSKLKSLIPSVCGGGGFGYAGVSAFIGPLHGEALDLVEYDSTFGGAHGALLGAGAGHYTFGVELMRTWRDWKEHISPIGLGGIEIRGASSRFGKNISTQSRDFGGLAQYENGKLSLGTYVGFTLGSGRSFGGGGYVTLSWRGCD